VQADKQAGDLLQLGAVRFRVPSTLELLPSQPAHNIHAEHFQFWELRLNRFLIAVCISFFSVYSNADNPITYPPCKQPFAGMEQSFFLLEAPRDTSRRHWLFVSKEKHPKLGVTATSFWMECDSARGTQKAIVAYDGFYNASPHTEDEDKVYYTEDDLVPQKGDLPTYTVYYSSCLNTTSGYPETPKKMGRILSAVMERHPYIGNQPADYVVSKDGHWFAYVDPSENLFANITVRDLKGSIIAFASRNMTVLNGCDPEDPYHPECNEWTWEVQNKGGLDSSLLATLIADKVNKNFTCPSPPTSVGTYLWASSLGLGVIGALGVGAAFLYQKPCKRSHYQTIPDIAIHDEL
jgi:hypothetical protein